MNEAHMSFIPKSKKLNSCFMGASRILSHCSNGDNQVAIDHILDLLKNKPKRSLKHGFNFYIGTFVRNNGTTYRMRLINFMKVIKKIHPMKWIFNARNAFG